MARAAVLLGHEYEFLLPVAPMLSEQFVREMIAKSQSHGPETLHLVPEALPALAHSRAGIIASGTATVEAAMMQTPFVMVYRVTPLTYLLGRWTVKVPHFAMANLISGRQVVPELVQADYTAEKVTAELKKIIPDGVERENMLRGLTEVRVRLRGDSTSLPAGDRAAQVTYTLLRKRAATPSEA
jgi:lipid-A-disaccharide synthase